MKVHSIDSVLSLNGEIIGVRGITKEGKWVDVSTASLWGITDKTLRSYTISELLPTPYGQKWVTSVEKASGRFATDGSFDYEATESVQKLLHTQQRRTPAHLR